MTTPQPAAHNRNQASTRHDLLDEGFAEILVEDFAIAYALTCWARCPCRGSYCVPREGSPGRSVGRGDCCQGYGRYRPAGCSLRALVVDADILDRIAQHLGVA
jgi:hypothetical protein